MTEREKLERDIETLRQAIRLDWQGIARIMHERPFDGRAQIDEILASLNHYFVPELRKLLDQLEADAQGS